MLHRPERIHESARSGGRHFFVFIFHGDKQENIRRLDDRFLGSETWLGDIKSVEDTLESQHVYSFYEVGFKLSDIWEYRLTVEIIELRKAAVDKVSLVWKHEKAYLDMPAVVK